MAIIVGILLFLIAFAIIANMGDMITAVIIMLPYLPFRLVFILSLFNGNL